MLKFCMVTSFFGPDSFGGDSVYIERLSAGLIKQGHEVHVAYSPGAFESVRGNNPRRKCELPEKLVLHRLTPEKSGITDSIWSHQTGRAGRIGGRLRKVFDEHHFDVIHFHNISLLGAEDLLDLAGGYSGTVVLLTLHDYWWLCSQSLFWKYSRSVCEAESCFRCNIRRRVPPQLWRRNDWYNQVLSKADFLLCPSRSVAGIYQSHGLRHPNVRIIPGILPEDWKNISCDAESLPPYLGDCKPYLAAAGRMVPEKGFHQLVRVVRNLPEVKLVIAGDGPSRRELMKISRGAENIHFTGLISNREVRNVFRESRAVVVPSLFPETFGLVAAEALALGIPVIARKSGSLPELIEAASGGALYDTEEELLDLVKSHSGVRGSGDNSSRESGACPPDVWFERNHVIKYLQVIREAVSSGKGLKG